MRCQSNSCNVGSPSQYKVQVGDAPNQLTNSVSGAHDVFRSDLRGAGSRESILKLLVVWDVVVLAVSFKVHLLHAG